MKVSVIGSGAWGTALAKELCSNGHKVCLWTRTEQQAEEMKRTGRNPRLDGIDLPDELRFTADLPAAASAEMVVMASPSFAVRETAKACAPFLSKNTILVSVAKGIEYGSLLRMSSIIEEETNVTPVVLSGPTHAEEVAVCHPTGCVAACNDLSKAEQVQRAFMNGYFRVYTSNDPVGVELCGAMKNILAIATGISDGLGLGDNAKALLMTRGIAEITRISRKLGGQPETAAGLAGVGDVIVTCTSVHSRNRRAGIYIGRGFAPDDALREVGAVVEGYYAARAARELSERFGIDMPISNAVYSVLYEKADILLAMGRLMTREGKNELTDQTSSGR